MAKKRANGEGNIRKRSDGRWEGRYTAGYNAETGKRIIKNVLKVHLCNKKAPKTEVFDAFWSCWADSNRRPHPYQGCALPTELQQHIWRPRRGSNPRPPA